MSEESTHPPVTLKDVPVIAVKGFFMGVAEIIPGVSGGTVALILGVYRRFIDAIKSYSPKSALRLLKALPDSAARGPALRAVHVDFLLPLLAGMGLAIVSLSGVMKGLLADYPAHMNGLFFGMILASVYVPPSKMKDRRAWHLLLGAAGLVVAYLVVGLPFVEMPSTKLTLFIFGAIAICAMVLPGVSGSYLLKILGQYETVIGAIHDRDLVTVAVFGAGCLVGITSFVRLLSFVLKRYTSATMAVLTGMMLGSLRSVWPFKEVVNKTPRNIIPESFDPAILGAMAAGFVVVVILIVVDRKLGGSD